MRYIFFLRLRFLLDEVISLSNRLLVYKIRGIEPDFAIHHIDHKCCRLITQKRLRPNGVPGYEQLRSILYDVIGATYRWRYRIPRPKDELTYTDLVQKVFGAVVQPIANISKLPAPPLQLLSGSLLSLLCGLRNILGSLGTAVQYFMPPVTGPIGYFIINLCCFVGVAAHYQTCDWIDDRSCGTQCQRRLVLL